MSCSFETGPIRPPSEATSILLRVVRNCPWNRCAFCPVYKGQKFSPRSLVEIKQDIDCISLITKRLLEESEKGDLRDIISEIAARDNIHLSFVQQVASWLHYGSKHLFLQDADSLVLKTGQLVEILKYMRKKLPSIERITCYSRAKTVNKRSLEELLELRNAGLNRLHIGLESGSGKVLEVLQKGVTPGQQVSAGLKVMAAGMELSEYYMPGAGGKELSRKHSLESARVLSQINPDYIRMRSTMVIPGTPLHKLKVQGTWVPLDEEEKIEEIRLFIENLEGATGTVESDHIMNLLEDVRGALPWDREKMLQILDRFLDMDVQDKESFILGRRLGYYRLFAHYRPLPEVERIKEQIKVRYTSIEAALQDLPRNY